MSHPTKSDVVTPEQWTARALLAEKRLAEIREELLSEELIEQLFMAHQRSDIEPILRAAFDAIGADHGA